MKVSIRRYSDSDAGECIVVREKDDPKFYRGAGWDKNYDASESRLLYRVKQELRKQGHDVIKKRMAKDGHLVDDTAQYIRTRDRKKGFMIYDHLYALRSIAEDFNKGHVQLRVEYYD